MGAHSGLRCTIDFSRMDLHYIRKHPNLGQHVTSTLLDLPWSCICEKNPQFSCRYRNANHQCAKGFFLHHIPPYKLSPGMIMKCKASYSSSPSFNHSDRSPHTGVANVGILQNGKNRLQGSLITQKQSRGPGVGSVQPSEAGDSRINNYKADAQNISD